MALNKKRRILITIDWFVPGYKAGGPIQSCANLIAHLKDSFEFWVITRDTDYCSDTPYQGITSDCWNQLEENVHVYYFSKAKLSPTSLYRVIKGVEADVFYINGVYSFYFSILPLISAYILRAKQIMIAGRGMFAAGSVTVKGGKKKLFFSVAKAVGLYKGVVFHATNEVEQEDIKAILGSPVQVKVAPNLPKKLTDQSQTVSAKNAGSLRMISVARISPEKNTRYALEVLSRYQGSGKISFDMFGPVYSEPYWQECLEVISQMPANVKVKYHGSIENNLVSEKLKNYHLLFMPTRGENFGHIILESLAAGRPVLISDKTPWRNLQGLGVGYDLPLTDEDSFIDAIETFVKMDEEEFNVFSCKAFSYAKDFMERNDSVDANVALFST
ncbi:glycosyltransferase [Pontibacter cellulosilyticus]|uniref:Glycosyltransferase n=1 Tax=Pontibacter cellulosilyticus TaxID=1720253 RepID=A0A923SHF1_9BACT|nr:glycosyltransferase [Pontibacter cellulosilyticus]MBC5991628.1 glycosyltransferase [Pontibacter cellulosilyticus]